MRSPYELLQKVFTTSFVRYLGVGGVAFILDFALTIICYDLLHLELWIAVAIGYWAGFFVNFAGQRNFSFRSDRPYTVSLVMYFALIGFNWLMQTMLMTLFVEILHLPTAVGKILTTGAAVTDVGSDYLALILLVAGAVATVYWLHREVRLSRKMTMVLVTIWLASTCIWAVVSFHRRALRLAAPAGTRPLEPAYLMQSALIAQGAALVSLLLLAWAIWRLPLRIGGIMPHVSSVAATLTFAAAAALSTSHIGGINRALYVFVIFAAVTVVALIVGVWKARAVAEAAAFAAGRARGDTDTGGPGRFVSNFAVVVLVAVAGIGAVRAGVGLYVNRAAWNTVETQVEQYRAGQVEAVLIPTSMPCDKLTWYYWPNDEAIGIFLGRYYGLPEAGVFAPVPNIASCPLLSR